MSKQADLLAYVFDGRPQLLSKDLLAWMDASPRFTRFVEIYKDKIRKKVRTVRERESSLDLRAEIELAARLLQDRRLEVVYEPYTSAGGRSPDFSVTFRTNLVFNVEAARLHPKRTAEGEPGGRILRVLLAKLGQMRPGMPNLLAIQSEEELARSADLGGLMQAVKLLAESKTPALFAASRYATPAAFFKDYLNLTGIVLWGAGSQVWVNRQARPALDEKVIILVSSLLSGEPGA